MVSFNFAKESKMSYFLMLLIICIGAWMYWNAAPTHDSSQPVQNVSSGVISYGKESLESLQANGLVTLDGTTIRGKLEVNGSVKANGATIGYFECNGHANLQDCQILAKTNVSGFLNATKCSFQGPITASTQKIEFNDCTLDSLVIKSPGWVLGSQVVELNGASSVKGDITFESGKGKITKSSQATIGGNVTGAEVTS